MASLYLYLSLFGCNIKILCFKKALGLKYFWKNISIPIDKMIVIFLFAKVILTTFENPNLLNLVI